MSYQSISAELGEEDLNAIKEAIATISRRMPFLVSLTKDERKSLYKMGPKSLDFVQDCRSISQNYAGILPADFNAAEFNRDTNLISKMTEINGLLVELCEKINDTAMAVGSEAMQSSLEVYKYVKTAADRKPGMKSVAERLGQRFKDQGKQKKE